MFVRKSLQQAGFTLIIAALLLTACNIGAAPAPTVDVNAINTAAVATAMGQLSAQFTQTALAAPAATAIPADTAVALATFPPPANGAPTTSGALPTVSFNSTPLVGFTPLASPLAPTVSSGQVSTASGCNDAVFVGETVPDKTQFAAGKAFAKAWELQNTGTCTWDSGYIFTFLADVSSPDIAGHDIVIKDSDTPTKPGHSQSFVIKLTAPAKSGEYFAYWKMQSDDGKFFGPRVYLDIIVK